MDIGNNLKKTNVLLTIVGIVAIYCLVFYFSFITIQFPFVGIEANYNDNNQVQVVSVDENSWAQSHNIVPGNIIHSVNGQSVSDYSIFLNYRILEQAKSISIDRGNGIESIQVESKLSTKDLMYQIIFPNISLLFCLGLSLILYLKKKNPSSIKLILFLLSISMGYVSAGASLRGDFIGRVLTTLTFLISPLLFIHFFQAYFKGFKKYILSKKFLLTCYCLVGINIFMEVIPFPTTIDIIKNVNLYTFSLFIFLLLYTAICTYIFNKDESVKVSLNLLLFSMCVSLLPFILFYVFPYLLFGESLYSPDILISSIIIIPLTLIYMLLSEKLFDFPFFLNRLQYNVVIALIICFFFWSILTFSSMNISGYDTLKMFLILWSVLVVLLQVKEHLERVFLGRYSIREDKFKQSILDFSSIINRNISREEFLSRLIFEMKEILSLTKIDLIEYDISAEEFTTIIPGYREDFLKSRKMLLSKLDTATIIENSDILLLGIQRENTKILFLICDGKRNKTRFNAEEKAWLRSLAQYSNIFLENIRKITEIITELEMETTKKQSSNWVKKLLFNIHEKQRTILSQDIHDTILQEQLLLRRKLTTVYPYITNLPDKVLECIEELDQGLLKLATTTRQTCHQLRPGLLLNHGIRDSLYELIDIYQKESSIKIKLDMNNFNLSIDEDYMLGIFRIVQELLTNAKKHSYASEIYLSIFDLEDSIHIHYEDNGVGMNMQNSTLQSSHSLGIIGMKERIESFDGSLFIDSSEDNGYRAFIELKVLKEVIST